MTPFEEFKLWLRQGAAFERVFAGIAAVIALGLISWVLVPTSESNNGGAPVAAGPTSESTATTLAGAATATGGTAPAAGGPVTSGPSGSPTPVAAGRGGGNVRAAGQSGDAAASACPEGG